MLGPIGYSVIQGMHVQSLGRALSPVPKRPETPHERSHRKKNEPQKRTTLANMFQKPVSISLGVVVGASPFNVGPDAEAWEIISHHTSPKLPNIEGAVGAQLLRT